ncbi:hypothetical protein BD410DRAFT_281638 [Rickenella mellea]|uniref:Uncharacterized protein n=1 Tax=Rickenella mellea TaxID=50990 RepID=A0A4Y7Q3G0_9AGAM|nr:hypothetical protein BD410DRAFT_281638 [Rickenella mellea]
MKPSAGMRDRKRKLGTCRMEGGGEWTGKEIYGEDSIFPACSADGKRERGGRWNRNVELGDPRDVVTRIVQMARAGNGAGGGDAYEEGSEVRSRRKKETAKVTVKRSRDEEEQGKRKPTHRAHHNHPHKEHGQHTGCGTSRDGTRAEHDSEYEDEKAVDDGDYYVYCGVLQSAISQYLILEKRAGRTLFLTNTSVDSKSSSTL